MNPQMANMQGLRPSANDQMSDPKKNIHFYIYDYFLKNGFYGLARNMINTPDLNMNLQPIIKQSPGSRNVNGVDAMDNDERGDLPDPGLPPGQRVENSFLLDWWSMFWDIYGAHRKGSSNPKAAQFSTNARHMANLEVESRKMQVMGMRQMPNNMGNMNPAQYQAMIRQMPNGVDPNAMKRAALNNRNPNGAGPMANNMNKQAMLMDMNGQRPPSPGSADAPSPNKRPRVEGGMNQGNMNVPFNEKSIEVYTQNLARQQRGALNDHAMVQGMNGAHGSPMNQQLEGQQDMFAQNRPNPGMPNATGPPGGNHALQDYQMQLMLLEQQNKKRLLMARQEQEPAAHQAGGAFPPSMSPQGSRSGPSPTPTDQMKRGTPKMHQPGLPASPMPDASMQPQRSSPAPGGMAFDVNQITPGMPPQFPGYNQMHPNPMMRAPSSHPGPFNGQAVNTQQQMEMMRQQNNGIMPNGGPYRGPGPQGMMSGPAQQMGGPMGNPQMRSQIMPPPPAPAAGEQPRAQEPSPSQPTQAPPTPSQTNKAAPKKKATKDNKKPPKAKGANAGATPASSTEDPPPTPTPSTPITPMHKNSFAQNGQPNQAAQPQPAAVPQPQPPMDDNAVAPFGNNLDDFNSDFDFNLPENADGVNFDFDSFLHVDNPDLLSGTDFNFES